MPRPRKIGGERNRLSWEGLLETFLNYKRAGQASERTINDYKYHVSRFFKAYPDCLKDGFIKEAALEYMADPNIKPATYNIRRANLNGFFNWTIAENYMKNAENPFKALPKRKYNEKVIEVPDDVLNRLLALPDQKQFTGLRDYGLVCLQLDTGIRPGEALQLLPSDVDLDHLEVNVRAEIAKTREPRILPISPVCAKALLKIMEFMRYSFDAEYERMPVFTTWEGNPIENHVWAKRFKKYYWSKLNWPKTITPYALRHTFAIKFLKDGGNVFQLQRLLGHANLEMTKVYIHYMKDDLKSAHRQASPLMSLVNPSKKRLTRV